CCIGTGTEAAGPSTGTSLGTQSEGPRVGPVMQSAPGTSPDGTDNLTSSGTDSHNTT
ncbi:hypothetical protein KI387_021261, partial [Taxus chinensis]